MNNLEACAYGYHINGEVLGIDCSDFEQIMVDAAEEISKIPTLQTENEKLRAELEQVKRERDTAVEDLRVCSIENNMECQYCLYRTARSFCWNCTDGSNWTWRSPQRED